MNRRKMELLALLTVILLLPILLSIQPVYPATSTTVSLNPKILYAEVGDSFKVNLTIQRVDYLYAWQANVTFNSEVLKFVNVTEGDFLARQPEGTYSARKIGEGYAFFGWTTKGVYAGESGSGTLATLEFEVLEQGECIIRIRDDSIYIPSTNTYVYPTYLVQQFAPNAPPNWKYLYSPTGFTVQNSIFLNTITPPKADFTYSPEFPGINQPVTFNASQSSATAPLEIIKYIWDFDDGNNATTEEPTVEHNFTEGGTYTVSLTVVDNATASELVRTYFNLTDSEMPLLWYQTFSTTEETIELAFQKDIAITNVVASETEVTVGQTISITVTLENVGIESTDCSVTVLYATEEVGTKQVTDLGVGDSDTLTFDWNTNGVAPGTYQIRAIASAEGDGDLSNNTFIDGTITLLEAAGSFPTALVIGGVVVAVVVIVVILFLLRRRKQAPST
jgi:PKD repeat protein